MGVAVREIKSATDYMNQNMGTYRPGEALPVLKRGCVNVICQNGHGRRKGRVRPDKENGSFPNAVVGRIWRPQGYYKFSESSQMCSGRERQTQNGVAELRILTIQNA